MSEAKHEWAMSAGGPKHLQKRPAGDFALVSELRHVNFPAEILGLHRDGIA